MKTKSTSQSAFFNVRVLLASVFCLAGVFIALGGIASSRAVGSGSPPSQNETQKIKIAPWVTEHTANGQQAEFFVVLADQADLSPAAALRHKPKKAVSSMAHYGTRPRPRRGRFCNGWPNAALSINPSTLLTQF